MNLYATKAYMMNFYGNELLIKEGKWRLYFKKVKWITCFRFIWCKVKGKALFSSFRKIEVLAWCEVVLCSSLAQPIRSSIS